MPIVDGMSSTKLIRSFEKSRPDVKLSDKAKLNGRIPIIAVSATLREQDRAMYCDAGFDGWILKPINFARLGHLCRGIVDSDLRSKLLYQPGQWEQGGWFHAEKPDFFAANTVPSEDKKPHAGVEELSQAKADELASEAVASRAVAAADAGAAGAAGGAAEDVTQAATTSENVAAATESGQGSGETTPEQT